MTETKSVATWHEPILINVAGMCAAFNFSLRWSSARGSSACAGWREGFDFWGLLILAWYTKESVLLSRSPSRGKFLRVSANLLACKKTAVDHEHPKKIRRSLRAWQEIFKLVYAVQRSVNPRRDPDDASTLSSRLCITSFRFLMVLDIISIQKRRGIRTCLRDSGVGFDGDAMTILRLTETVRWDWEQNKDEEKRREERGREEKRRERVVGMMMEGKPVAETSESSARNSASIYRSGKKPTPDSENLKMKKRESPHEYVTILHGLIYYIHIHIHTLKKIQMDIRIL